MWTPSEFDQALSVVSEKYKTLERQMSWLKPYDRDQAYAIYINANDSVFGFLVCGRTRINSKRDRFKGSSIEEIDLYNLGATHHSAQKQDVRASLTGKGSILHYNKDWHFLLNDSWLLGGVHAEAEFHLASPRHRDNVVDPAGGYLTVTGRELTGLKEFGYRFVSAGYLDQEIAICSNKAAARAADFAKIWAAVERQDNGARVDQSLIDPAANLVDPGQGNVDKWQKSVPFGPQQNF
jgi:hypothetical protein